MIPNARSEAITAARHKVALNPIYLDTETTGLDRTAEIVEISLVESDGSLAFNSLVRPTARIPADAIRIHGITNELAAAAPTWPVLWPQIEALLAGRAIGIYNATFDLRMLEQTHARLGLPWRGSVVAGAFCIMKLFAQYNGEWDRTRGSYRFLSLEQAGRRMRVHLPNSHRAKDDALLARAVLLALAEQQN
jgi:DNA polymerase-3 subunit epsilon